MQERIVVCEIDVKDDWRNWRPSQPVTVLQPEHDYEGASFALCPSVRGIAPEPVRELRDPAIFEDDSKLYLLYSIAGESGIAIAHISMQPD